MLPIDRLSGTFVYFLADASIRAAVLFAIAVLVIGLVKRRSPSLHHAVWTVVTASMLALPFVSTVLPPLRLPGVLQPADWGVFRHAAAPSPAETDQPRIHRAEPIVIQLNGSGAVSTNSAPDARRIFGWPAALSAFYLVGVIVMLLRVVTGLLLGARLVAQSSTLRLTRANEALEDLAIQQRLSFPWPCLYESNAVSVPVLVAGQRSAIVLPERWREWDEWTLRAVLAHELTHVRRGDCAVLFLAAVNKAVFWFHPVAWWLPKRLSALSEQASDDAAATATGDPIRYARIVVELASQARTAGRRLVMPASALSMAGNSPVSQRVNRLLDSSATSSGVLPLRYWLAVTVLSTPLVSLVAAAQISPPPITGQTANDVTLTWPWVSEGFRTTAEEARLLEDRLVRDPQALAARAQLLAYYVYNANPRAAAPHARWVIEHRPESELAASPPVNTGAIDLSSREEARHTQQELKQLWVRQAALHDRDARVLCNAGAAVMMTEPSEAERLLLRARELDRANGRALRHLARLYTEALMSESYQMAGVIQPGWRQRFDSGFAARARDALDRSPDAELIGTVGSHLAQFVTLSFESRPGFEAQIAQARRSMREYASALLKRAVATAPAREEFARALRLLEEFPGGVGSSAVRSHEPGRDRAAAEPTQPSYEIPPSQQKELLVASNPPAYPPLARRARIQGVVRFRVRIGADGQVRTVTLVNGHPLLVPSAMEFVQTHVYRPTLLNGQPVEVETLIDVPFVLAER